MPSEQPPDPGAAAEAALRARRMAWAADGLPQIIMSLYFIAFVLAGRLLVKPTSLSWFWCVAFLFYGLVNARLTDWLRRKRLSEGAYVTGIEAEGERREGHTLRDVCLSWSFLVYLAVGLAAAAVVFLLYCHFFETSEPFEDAAVVCAVCVLAACGAALLRLAWTLRLWEIALLGTGVIGFMATKLAVDGWNLLENIDLWWGGFCVFRMLPATFLHLRWRRWVQSLPVNEPPPGSGSEVSA